MSRLPFHEKKTAEHDYEDEATTALRKKAMAEACLGLGDRSKCNQIEECIAIFLRSWLARFL